MASRQTLEQALKNPNVRQFLNLISHTEGTDKGNGYHTAFGGSRLGSLKDHPRYLKSFTQKNGKTNKTSAAGRYQFLRGTWDGLAKQYGLTDFGAHSQDLGAVALLAQNGSLPHILKGDWQTAVKKSGATWASLPSAPAAYSQPTRSWQSVAEFVGGNAASQQDRPQADPRLSMSAPDLLATLRKGKDGRTDVQILYELANNNGLAGREIKTLLSQGHGLGDIAGQLGLKIPEAQAQPEPLPGFEQFAANYSEPEPLPSFEEFSASYEQPIEPTEPPSFEDFAASYTPSDDTGEPWQTQKTLSDSTSNASSAKALPMAKSSWESLS